MHLCSKKYKCCQNLPWSSGLLVWVGMLPLLFVGTDRLKHIGSECGLLLDKECRNWKFESLSGPGLWMLVALV